MLCEAVLKHSFWPLSARPLQDIHPMEVVKLMKAVEVIETPNKTTLKRFRHWSWNAHFLVWSLEDFWILKSRVGQWIQLESFLKKTASLLDAPLYPTVRDWSIFWSLTSMLVDVRLSVGSHLECCWNPHHSRKSTEDLKKCWSHQFSGDIMFRIHPIVWWLNQFISQVSVDYINQWVFQVQSVNIHWFVGSMS